LYIFLLSENTKILKADKERSSSERPMKHAKKCFVIYILVCTYLFSLFCKFLIHLMTHSLLRNILYAIPPHRLFSSGSVYAMQRNFDLCIPRKGIARPQSPFPHSFVCERSIFPRSAHLFSCSSICRPIPGIYINRSQKHECRNWD
jgi:hypothetical protein